MSRLIRIYLIVRPIQGNSRIYFIEYKFFSNIKISYYKKEESISVKKVFLLKIILPIHKLTQFHEEIKVDAI
jgi:hypothetical protein